MTDGQERGRALAEALAAGCARLLGDLVVAVIVHGSLTLGDYTPGRSDIDILVVVERTLSDGEIAALQEMVARLQANAPGGIDFRVVTREVAASPMRAPPMELYVGLRACGTAEIETRVAGERDLIAELSMVRVGGRSLIGAEPRLIVGAIPHEWVVAYGDQHLARWQRLIDDAENAELMVLTTCRIWRFATEGAHCSKADAGRWALARHPSLRAVKAALRQRAGELDVRVEPADIAHLLSLVRTEIARRIACP
jgi:predicted nucleotidyltransferase